MKKNILFLATLTLSNSMASGKAITGGEISQNILQHTTNAFTFVKNHAIVNLLNEITCGSQVASADKTDVQENGYIFGRGQSTKDKLLPVAFAAVLNKNGNTTADLTLATFFPKIESILKIQLVQECLEDIVKMDLTSSPKITDGSVTNLTALKTIQEGYTKANMHDFLQGLKDLTFFKDDSSVMKFVKKDGSLEANPATTPDESLLAQLFGSKTIFGVTGLTPQIFLQTIKLTKTDIKTAADVSEIAGLGKIINDSTTTQDVPTVAAKILDKAQKYITTSMAITHFNGTGYGKDEKCGATIFDQSKFDAASKEEFYSIKDYNNGIALAKNSNGSNTNNQAPSSNNQNPSNNSPTPPHISENIDKDEVVAFISNPDNAKLLQADIQNEIKNLEGQKTLDGPAQKKLEALKILFSNVSEATGYWETMTKGSNGDKISFISLPIFMSGVTGCIVFFVMKDKKNGDVINQELSPNDKYGIPGA